MAFQFSDQHASEVRAYLSEREGRDFSLRELPIVLEDRSSVLAELPIYSGRLLPSIDVDVLAEQIVKAKGSAGPCTSYVANIAQALAALGIDDPEVMSLWKAVQYRLRPQQ